MEKKVPFAKYNGRMVAPEEVEKHCTGLTCPDCGLPLMVRKGDKRIHHFAHLNGGGGASCGETALHLMAKQIVAESKYIVVPGSVVVFQDGRRATIPPQLLRIVEAKEEYRIRDIIPDIFLVCEKGYLAVEIFVNHKVDEEKKAKLNSMRINALEIDLSHQLGISKEALTKLLLEGTQFKSWLSLFVTVNLPPQQRIPVPRRHPYTHQIDLDNLQPYSRKNYSNKKRTYYKKRKQR